MINFKSSIYITLLAFLSIAVSANELDSPGIVEDLNSLAYEHIKSGEYSEAFKYAEQARVNSFYYNNNDQLARALTNIGSCYFYLQQFEKATLNYKSALEVARKNNNIVEISRALNNLGTVNLEIKNYSEAYAFYKQAYEVEKGRKEITELSHWQTIVNLTQAAVLAGEYPEYEIFTELMEQKAADINDPFSLVYYFQIKGDLAVFNKDYDNAESHYHNALKLAEKHEYQALEKEVILDLTDLFLIQSRLNDAQKLVDLVLNSPNNKETPDQYIRAHRLAYQLSKQQDLADKALHHLEEALELEASSRDITVRHLSEITKIEFQTEQQKEALQRVQKINQQLNAKLESTKLKMWLGWSLFTLAISVIAVFALRARR